ncbi:unnamed protein product [Musa acuminata subsp. burmannicoides]
MLSLSFDLNHSWREIKCYCHDFKLASCNTKRVPLILSLLAHLWLRSFLSSAASLSLESRLRVRVHLNNSRPSSALNPRQQGLKCPRCDSPNTKFCYYNNYSLSQPRHFCKTCRRYWTKGGALRNVPMGGGSRKNKKSKSSASSRLPAAPLSGFLETGSSLKFLDGLPSSVAMAFQIGLPAASGLHDPATSTVFNSNQFINFFLSSINQDLHWKLQQQRLAMIFGEEAHKQSSSPLEIQQEFISFEVSDIATDEVCGCSESGNTCVATGTNSSMAWLPESSNYTIPTSTAISINRVGNVDGNNSGDKSSTNINISYWNGIPAWNDIPQFSTLPYSVDMEL